MRQTQSLFQKRVLVVEAWCDSKELSKAFLDGAMTTPTTRPQYSRGELRYESDLSDVEWRLILGSMPRQRGYGRPRREAGARS